MKNLQIRFTITIVIYMTGTLLLIWTALTGEKELFTPVYVEKSLSDSSAKFQNILFWQKIKDEPQAYFKGERLNWGEKGMDTKSPSGRIFLRNSDPIDYEGENGFFENSQQKVTLSGKVTMKRRGAFIKASKCDFYTEQRKTDCEGRVFSDLSGLKNGDNLKIRSQSIAMDWEREEVLYQGGVRGRLRRRYPFEQGIQFQSDEVKIFKKDLKADFKGSVRFNYGDIKSRSQRGELFLDNYNKKLKYYVLYDDIEVVQNVELSDGSFFMRKAYAEKLEAFNKEKKIVLKGAPTVSQGKDTMRGYRITLFADKEIMEVENSSSVIKLKDQKD